MVAEVSAVPAQAALPSGVRLLPVTDPAGVGLLIEVHERVFGTDHSRLHRSLLAQLRDRPEVTAMVVAMAGDEPVPARHATPPLCNGTASSVGSVRGAQNGVFCDDPRRWLRSATPM
jgi:hypothetical protein